LRVLRGRRRYQRATRIYELVAAVKRFTYMDKLAGPDSVDVQRGFAIRYACWLKAKNKVYPSHGVNRTLRPC
jgi:hypothetical protein